MHPEFCGSEVCVLQDSFTCKQQKAQLQFSSAGGAGGQGLWALGRGQAPYVRAARTPSRGSLGFVLLPVAAAALLSGREGPGAPRRGRGPGRGASGVGGQGVRPASLPAGLALPRCSRGRWLGVRCAEPRVARVWTRQRRAGRREPPSPRPHEPETCPSGRRVPFAGIFLFLLCAEVPGAGVGGVLQKRGKPLPQGRKQTPRVFLFGGVRRVGRSQIKADRGSTDLRFALGHRGTPERARSVGR